MSTSTTYQGRLLERGKLASTASKIPSGHFTAWHQHESTACLPATMLHYIKWQCKLKNKKQKSPPSNLCLAPTPVFHWRTYCIICVPWGYLLPFFSPSFFTKNCLNPSRTALDICLLLFPWQLESNLACASQFLWDETWRKVI